MRALQVIAALATLVILAGCGSDPPRPAPATRDATPAPSTVRPAPDTQSDPAPAPPAAKPTIEPVVAATIAPAAIRTTPRLTGDYAEYPAAIDLIERLSRQDGFDRDYLYRLFSRLERQDWILDYLDRPKPPPSKGPTGSWGRYRAKFLTEDRIARGVRFWGEHARDLQRNTSLPSSASRPTTARTLAEPPSSTPWPPSPSTIRAARITFAQSWKPS